MQIKKILIIFFIFLYFSSLTHADNLNFSDLQRYYNSANSYLIYCQNNKDNQVCNSQNIDSAKRTIITVFYNTAVRFYDAGLLSEANKSATTCKNFSVSENYQDLEIKCNIMLESINKTYSFK